ncbi:hypothetical protein ACH5RR_009367 [Cinchona calisaya]|uniref:Uncharacterized protein n=1 Tax=Cinchona calisaya TaxID=153742 RepID=A0ABD3ADZ2_9GENT
MATFANPDNKLIRDAEIKSDKGSLPPKRNLDVTSQNKENIDEETDDANKKLKLGSPSIGNNDPSTPDAEATKDVNGTEDHSVHLDENKEQVKEEEKENDDNDEDEEDYEDEEGDDDDEEYGSDDEDSNGNAEIIDPKGKGIMRDDKGKGKLVEESENSSDCGSVTDADTDLSDDSLAEVDLDNILPSRTRRRKVQPGVCILKNQGTKKDEDDNSNDSSS